MILVTREKQDGMSADIGITTTHAYSPGHNLTFIIDPSCACEKHTRLSGDQVIEVNARATVLPKKCASEKVAATGR